MASVNAYDLFVLLVEGNPRLPDRFHQVIVEYEDALVLLQDFPPMAQLGLPESSRKRMASREESIASELALLYAIKAGLALRVDPQNPELASRWNDRALELDPGNRLSRRFQIDLGIISREGAEGEDEFHSRIRVMVEDGDLAGVEREYLAFAEVLAGRADHQKVLYQELAGKFTLWAKQAGGATERREFLGKAVEYYTRVLDLDEDDELSRRNLAVTYSILGEFGRAIFHYEHLERNDRLGPDDRRSFANLYLRRGTLSGNRRTSDEVISDLERHVRSGDSRFGVFRCTVPRVSQKESDRAFRTGR